LREGYDVVGSEESNHSVRLRARLAERLRLAGEDAVRWIGPVPVFALHNDMTRAVVHADEAQQAPYSLRGAGVAVGVWDESAALPHPDYASRLTQVDPEGNNPWHATHVTGTMAGDGSSSAQAGGAAYQWRGMAPAATILSYQFNPPTALMSKS